jgi:hypothetical protein
MRLNRAFIVAALLLLGASSIRADGVSSNDPRIIIGKGVDSKPVGQSFLVPVDISGGGVGDFDNGSATQNIIELIFRAQLNKKDTVTCAPDVFFGECTVTSDRGNKVTITFSDPLNGGIPPGADFFVGLDDMGKKTGGWKQDGVKDLQAQAVFATVPEPGTFLLLLSGIGSIWLSRKRRSSPETDV